MGPQYRACWTLHRVRTDRARVSSGLRPEGAGDRTDRRQSPPLPPLSPVARSVHPLPHPDYVGAHIYASAPSHIVCAHCPPSTATASKYTHTLTRTLAVRAEKPVCGVCCVCVCAEQRAIEASSGQNIHSSGCRPMMRGVAQQQQQQPLDNSGVFPPPHPAHPQPDRFSAVVVRPVFGL